MWLVPLLVTKETWPPESGPYCVGIAGGHLEFFRESRGRGLHLGTVPEVIIVVDAIEGNVGLVVRAPFTEPARRRRTGDVRAVAVKTIGLQAENSAGIAASKEGRRSDPLRRHAHAASWV